MKSSKSVGSHGKNHLKPGNRKAPSSIARKQLGKAPAPKGGRGVYSSNRLKRG